MVIALLHAGQHSSLIVHLFGCCCCLLLRTWMKVCVAHGDSWSVIWETNWAARWLRTFVTVVGCYAILILKYEYTQSILAERSSVFFFGDAIVSMDGLYTGHWPRKQWTKVFIGYCWSIHLYKCNWYLRFRMCAIKIPCLFHEPQIYSIFSCAREYF